MRRALKILGVLILAAAVAGAVLIYSVINSNWGREQVRTRALAALSRSTHGIVRIGSVSGNLARGVTLHDVSVTDSAGAPLLTAKAIESTYGIRELLLSRKIDLSNVRIVNADVVLDRPTDGEWNYDRIFPILTKSGGVETPGIQFGDWVVLRDVELVNSHLTVRLPWTPSSSVRAAVRDSVVRAALEGRSRLVVVKNGGGYQRVQEYRDVNARLPLVRISHPDFHTRLITVDSLRMTALFLAPPAVSVRQAAGTIELDHDSVWFDIPHVALPASLTTLSGRYVIDNGNLRLHSVATPAALADVRFVYPPLPAEGHASFTLDLDWSGEREEYMLRNIDLKTGTATATGEVGVTVADTLKLHEFNITFAGVETALLEKVAPGLKVPRKGTLSGRAKLDGPLAAMQVDGDVNFTEAQSGTSRVIAVGELGATKDLARMRNLHVKFTPVQMDLARIRVADVPLLGSASGSAVLNGSSRTQIEARDIDLTHLDRGERSHLTGTATVRFGAPNVITVDAIADPLSLITVGRFAPSLTLRGAVAGPIQLSGPSSNLSVNTTLRTSDGGTVAATGTIDIASQETGYNLDMVAKLFNANLVAEKAPRTSLSATMSAHGRGFDPATMMADLRAKATTSTFDTVAVDSLGAHVRIGAGIANVDSLSVRVPGAWANVTGAFGLANTASGTLNYVVQVDSIARFARYVPRDSTLVVPRPATLADRLALAREDSARTAERLAVARAAGAARPATPVVVDSPPSFRMDSLGGTARAQGSLIGGFGGFDLRGTAQAANLLALGNTVARADAKYAWLGALTPRSAVEATVSGDTISAKGFALDSVLANVTYAKPGGTARLSVFQNSRRDYAMNAAYEIYPDQKVLRLQDLRLRFDSTQWTTARPSAVRWGKAGYEVDSLDLRNGATGRLFANGRVPVDATADLRLNVKDFQVSDVTGLLQSDLAASGLFSADARIQGTGTAPVIAGTAGIVDARYRQTVMPDLQTQFNYSNKRLMAQADATHAGRSMVVANASIPVNLAMSGVKGSRLLDGASDVSVKADSMPLELLPVFTDALSDVRGYAVGSVALKGCLTKPDVLGEIKVVGGEATVTSVGVRLLAMNGVAHLKGDTVVIDSLTATSGGRLALSGSLGIANLLEPSFDLRLVADQAQVLNNKKGKLRANAQITMRGPFDAVAVNGRARVLGGVLYIPKPDSREMISAGDPAVFAVFDTTGGKLDDLLPAPSPLMSNLRMNLRLGVDHNTWIRSTEANVEVYSDGDLRINMDQRRGRFTLDGIVNTDRGEYEFLAKRFQIKRGTATFVGSRDINPLLQFTGEYDVQQAAQQSFKIKVQIGGTLLAPRLTLTSDAQPPISESDLLSYLAFGAESGSLLQFGGSSLSGGTVGGVLVGTSAALATKQLTTVAFGVLVNEWEGQAARSLGADVFNITPANIQPELANPNFTGLGTFFKGTAVEYGRYFTPQTYVGLNLAASTLPGFRIEHRLDNRGLSLESTLQPRYFLPEATLAPQGLKKANALGLFLVRRWRF